MSEMRGAGSEATGKVGERLAAARIEQHLSIDDIAARTRIPRRHLEALERSEGPGMAGTTYTIGFAKSFARAVNLDPNRIARDLRAELGAGRETPRHMVDVETADPSRVPPRILAVVFVLLAIGIAVGYGLWRSGAFGDDAELRARLAAGTLQEGGAAPVGSIGGAQPAAPPAGSPARAADPLAPPVPRTETRP